MEASENVRIRQITVTVLPDGRVERADAAAYIGISAGGLAGRNARGLGPKPRYKMNRRIYYHIDDLKEFVAEELKRCEIRRAGE